jgi:hypothetical protein
MDLNQFVWSTLEIDSLLPLQKPLLVKHYIIGGSYQLLCLGFSLLSFITGNVFFVNFEYFSQWPPLVIL